MAVEKIVASVILKSRSGLSVINDFDKFTFSKINEFRPKSSHIDKVCNLLTQAGFTIEAHTDAGISFSGSKDLFEAEFKAPIRKQEFSLPIPGAKAQRLSFFQTAQPVKLMSERIAALTDAVELAVPGVPFHNAAPPAPAPPYYLLQVTTDVPNRLNVNPVHAAGITGAGVRVSMVDTGFVSRVTETHISDNATQVTVEHDVRDVQGVWLATDPGHTGANYYGAGASFAGDVVTLDTPLPAPNTNVEIVYSCLHPHYTNQGYNIDDIRAVGGLDVNTDEYGHGTAEAANVLGVAPGAAFSFVKYSDGGANSFPLAGFQSAVQNQNPDIITCSWGTVGSSPALHLEAANAVANGIVVVFAAGNGHTDAGVVKPIAHPSIISVGGAYPINGGGFRASNYASSYDSVIYTSPQRHCPDVVGLVGETPRAVLIMLPTEPDNSMDTDLANSGAFPNGDNTAADDGWCVVSGTSAAAPQTAGMAALLLEQHPALTPMAVKNILQNSAVDIQNGASANGDVADNGWDAATGFGLIDGQAAIGFLNNGQFNAYIRDSIEDNGAEPVVANRLYTSPDIIVRSELVADPQDELGQTIKHRHDLSYEVEDGQENYIYLRVQNRGTITGDCTAAVYFTQPGMFANPASWTNLGNINIQNLAPGEFRVVGPLSWPDAQIPGSGHYCLICILDSPGDPAPNLAAISSTADFINMVRNSNNVAWKNIRIVDIIPGGSDSYSFYMEGPAGTWHQAELRIDLTGFVPGGSVLVKVVKRLADTAVLNNLVVTRDTSLYTTLTHQGGIGSLESMDFKSNERTKVTIYYSIPAGTPDGDYPIVAALFVDGNDMGRFTQVARVSHFSFVGNRRSRELHRKDCPWLRLMSPYNRIPFGDIQQAHRRGYDNCAFCIGGSLR